MYILRNVTLKDLNNLYELSGKVLFINLPHDKRIIENKIRRSLECFENPSSDKSKNYYFFVLEDTDNDQVVGVSMIHAQHGTDEEPHFFLRVSQENKFSSTINTGFVHGTLRLGLDTNGPTEIGGLVVHPDYRGIKGHKLGKQISFVRFLYMAKNPDRFKDTIHSELMPPLDANGHSPLWEAVGRRFMNMEYNEADILSRNNKEFILSLFPANNIYMTLLPMKARNAIGKVGKDTLPVKNMLEKIGFRYNHEVDPFDGGPHYRCRLNDIKLVKEQKRGKLTTVKEYDDSSATDMLISFKYKDYNFFSIRTSCIYAEEEFILPQDICTKFGLKEGQEILAITF